MTQIADNDELQLYLSRVRPIYSQLFNMAFAITGNSSQAEYALQYAMMDYWSEGGANGRHGFREGLKNTLVRTAVKDAGALKADAEFDWNGLAATGAAMQLDPIHRLAAAEPVENRRIITLRYGCGLSVRRIARLTGSDGAHVRTALSRFEARARRRLSTAERRRLDSRIARTVRNDLSTPGSLTPEIGNVFRTFEADAVSAARPNRLPARIAQLAAAILLALTCMLVFWLAAVLIQPAVLEEDVAPAATQAIVSDVLSR